MRLEAVRVDTPSMVREEWNDREEEEEEAEQPEREEAYEAAPGEDGAEVMGDAVTEARCIAERCGATGGIGIGGLSRNNRKARRNRKAEQRSAQAWRRIQKLGTRFRHERNNHQNKHAAQQR